MVKRMLFTLLVVAVLVGVGHAQPPRPISVWQTTRDVITDRLAPGAPLFFNTTIVDASTINATSVIVNASQAFQTIFGFGGAITDSAMHVFHQLDADAQLQLVSDLYGENSDNTSLRYTTARLTIGSCDYSLEFYSYNDQVNDTTMSNFTIAHDEAQLIPFILTAQATAAAFNRPFRSLSSPWSPPAWMKTNGRMSCAPVGPLDCGLVPAFADAYALYTSRYLSAFAVAGVSIWGVTVQNEPEAQTGTLVYEGMYFPAGAERAFVADHLGPRLRADHPDIKIFIYDHNMGADMVAYATAILSDPAASEYVAGTAFHWYNGPHFDAVAEVQARFPDKLLLASEATVARGYTKDWWREPSDPASPDGVAWWANGEFYGTFILNDLANGAVGFIDWNILLDDKGGPDHGDPTGERCEGVVLCGSAAMLLADVSLAPPVVYKQAFYWYMAHVSRFVPPDSVRLGLSLARATGTNATSPVLGGAFATPMGDTVLVLMNPQNTSETVTMHDARYGTTTATLPAHGIQTWVY